jgi:hypothetical protein
MPHIHIVIGGFEKTVRGYPIKVHFPDGTRERLLTREESRALWLTPINAVAEGELSSLLFHSIMGGFEADWAKTLQLLKSESVATTPVSQPVIRILLEIADLELNELPWELAVTGFGPGCAIIRFSQVAIQSCGKPLKLPIEAVVVATRDPIEVPVPDQAFNLDEALQKIFGPHPNIPHVFRSTALSGANGEDVAQLLPGRRFDIVHLSVRTEWLTLDETTGAEGALWLQGAVTAFNASDFQALAGAETRLLILQLPADLEPRGVSGAFDLAWRVRAAGGPAILIVQVPNAPGIAKEFLYAVYDGIVHDTPLDSVLLIAKQRWPAARPVLFLAPGGEEALRISPLADGLKLNIKEKQDLFLSLQSRADAVVGDPGSKAVLLTQLTQGLSLLQQANQSVTNIVAWDHESGGILPLREAMDLATAAENTYQSVVDQIDREESGEQRVVNTSFQSAGRSLPSTESLVVGRDYIFTLDIGAPSKESNVQSARPIPESYLQPFYDQQGGVDLRVCLFSQQFQITSDSQLLRLPRSGPSPKLDFPVTAPPRSGHATLRACVYHRQNLLQSLLVQAKITAEPQTGVDGGNIAEVEFTLSDQLQNLENLPSRTLNILLNENPEGTHTFAILGDNIKKQFSIDQGNEVKLARKKLLDICTAVDTEGKPSDYLYRDDDNSGDERKFSADVKELAYWGWKLYCRFIMEPPDDDFESKLENTLRQPASIQISSTRSARYVYPWSIVYDKALIASPKNNIVCPTALSAIQQANAQGLSQATNCPQNACGYAQDSNVVCPFRFWGFKHSIEQPPGAGKIVRDIFVTGDPKCAMGAHAALSGDQHRKEIERECRVKTDYHESKNDIGTSLKSTKPHLIYFYCHGGRTLSAPWLGVGQDEHIESSDFKAWNARWPDTRPLVIINGCHTVDLSPDDLLDFVTAFIWTGASGIVGTEICIPESLAREFGREFLREFLGGRTVADSMRLLRLRLLAKYNLLGLAFTPYCYGDLHVTKTSN